MFNPDKKYIHSDGVDLPIMYCYLAGRIAGECIDKCLEWRHKIINHYADYNEKGVYPIAFLDALNSKEADSIDKKGLTSSIPPNLIYDKDILSVEKADVIVAMMDDYMENGLEGILNPPIKEYFDGKIEGLENFSREKYQEAYLILRKTILNRRPNWGTDYEVSIAMYLKKPVILIAGNERRKEMLEKHPFMKRASVIVGSVDELLEKKWLNILYKSISGAIY
jgi:nucleoside 2-deoxyribosyltransferase